MSFLARSGLGGLGREPWALFAIRMLNSAGFSMAMPFFGIYLLDVRGVSLTMIGLVYFMSGMTRLGSQLIGGRITDAVGPKKVMLFGYGSGVVTSSILGYMVLANATSYLFFIVYPLFSLVRGVSMPASGSIIAEQPSARLKSGYNLLTIGGNLGFAVGPAVGGPVAEILGYSDVFFLSALFMVPVTIVTVVMIRGGLRHHNEEEGRKVKRSLSWKDDRNLISFLLLTGCLFLAVGYEITPMSLYVADFLGMSNVEIGYLFATNGLVIVLLQVPLINLVSRSKNFALPLLIAPLLAAGSFVIAGLSSTFLQFEGVMVLLTLAEILVTVPSQTVVSLFSQSGNRGTYQGYYYATFSTGKSVASAVGPTTFELLAFAPALGWYGVAVFTLMVFVGFAIVGPRVQRDYEASSLTAAPPAPPLPR